MSPDRVYVGEEGEEGRSMQMDGRQKRRGKSVLVNKQVFTSFLIHNTE